MGRVYISSTFEDLRQHRAAVAAVLRQMQHQVIGMEDYAASDNRPLRQCVEDIRRSDLYVGIYAWRYGFQPPEGDGRSITELEYVEAGRVGIPRLIFLLRDAAPWSPALMDHFGAPDRGQKIIDLRARLRLEHTIREFATPDDLAASVSAAVSLQAATTSRIEQREFLSLAKAEGGQIFLSSLVPNLVEGISHARQASILEIDFGSTEWWSTRLLLVALLCFDYTAVDEIVFLDNQRFVGSASVRSLRAMLSLIHAEVERLYRRRRDEIPVGQQKEINEQLNMLLLHLLDDIDELPGGGERAQKVNVDASWLRAGLGAELSPEAVEAPGGIASPLVLYEIISKRGRYVPLVHEGRLERVVDRQSLATQVASAVLRERLGA